MGGRFCGLDQLYKNFSGNDVFPSPKLNEDQKQEKCSFFSTKLSEAQKTKKVFAENCIVFTTKLGEDYKKRSSP